MNRRLLSYLSVATLMFATSIEAHAHCGKCGEGEQKPHKHDIVDTAIEAGSFKTLAAALTAAELVDTLKGDGPFTVFAPTDDAFAKLPRATVETLLNPENKDQLAAILTYHVVAGKLKASDVVKLKGATSINGQRIDVKVFDEGVKVDEANVIKTDIQCANGVIHVIDSVILPETESIPEVAAGAGTFKTLLAAAKAAGLAEALSGKGPLTVFAPSDEAFGKLPKGTVESLLKPANKTELASILKYHVVSGRVYSEDVARLSRARTLEGGSVSIRTKDGLRVNKAHVVATDIDAANGVIHVIDAVLIPPMKRADARRLLERTVASGAPMYNSGHHQQCAELYKEAMNQLMNATISGFDEHDYRRMRTTLTRAENEHHAGRRAWILRHGIDRMYSQLSEAH